AVQSTSPRSSTRAGHWVNHPFLLPAPPFALPPDAPPPPPPAALPPGAPPVPGVGGTLPFPRPMKPPVAKIVSPLASVILSLNEPVVFAKKRSHSAPPVRVSSNWSENTVWYGP